MYMTVNQSSYNYTCTCTYSFEATCTCMYMTVNQFSYIHVHVHIGLKLHVHVALGLVLSHTPLPSMSPVARMVRVSQVLGPMPSQTPDFQISFVQFLIFSCLHIIHVHDLSYMYKPYAINLLFRVGQY